MRKVIVNSTPLIALSKVGRLGLLKQMYGEVYIPDAVFQEVTKKNDRVKEELIKSAWIHIETVKNDRDRRMYSAKLHAGEVEVMMLALESDADSLVVIDDYAARKTADFLGLNLTGTIGMLIKAKMQGMIDHVMPIIEEMELQGIYYSNSLKEQIKTVSGEK